MAAYNELVKKHKLKDKVCVYCTSKPAENEDHVFARQFLLESRRANLPKVPACLACNNEKSKLELYLATVLPFGGLNTDAHTILEREVPRRIEGNQKLFRVLSSGESLTKLPFEGEQLHRLIAFIVRGLWWSTWSEILPATHDMRVISIDSDAEKAFASILGFNAIRVSGNVGEGTFIYEGLRAPQDAGLSVWFFKVFGGVSLAEDDQRSTTLCAVSTSKEFLARPNVAAIFG